MQVIHFAKFPTGLQPGFPVLFHKPWTGASDLQLPTLEIEHNAFYEATFNVA